jgi:Tol biopolymer transport system component
MTDEQHRWSRVKEIFHAALVRAPDERAAFLRIACGEDVALEREAESLLAAHAAAGSFAERAAIEVLVPPRTPDRIEPAMAAGTEFGTYRILGPLDAGGMGEVYRALDTRLDREVAVKVLPRALAEDPERIVRLQREARMLAALNHPHIATIHGLEVAAGVHAIVMELIDGPTLAERLARGALPVGETLEIARQIAGALEAAHEKGIIHHDLKPANILLTATGAVRVLDFGLAMTANSGANAQDTVAGTPAYMSPEHARGERTDARADVWAFGCVVYEMLTGSRAFGHDTMAETQAAIFERGPDWDRVPAHVSAGIRRMLRRCLDKDPHRRLHAIADARIEIEDAGSDAEAMGSASKHAAIRRRGLVVSAAALFTLLASAATFWAMRPHAPKLQLTIAEITTPRTFDPWSFALAPDGRRIAFVADHDGYSMLWVRDLGSGTARVLAGTEAARRPFWSPDGRSIGYFANSDLKRIDAAGGSVRTIAYALGGTTAAWGPDGSILFSGADAPALRKVNASGGNVTSATAPAADSTGHRHPQFLPDGRQFLFFSGGPNAVRGVYLGSLDSTGATRLLASDTQGAYVSPGWLLFVRDGVLLAQSFDLARRALSGEPITVADSVAVDPITGSGAFSTSDAGVLTYRIAHPLVTRLSWFDRAGSSLGTFGSAEQIGLSNLRLSPDGRRVIAERTLQNETDLWMLDSTRQTRFTLGADGNIARLPIWSPNGDRIAFESIGSGSVKLVIKSASGGDGEEMLFKSPQGKIPCDWSPDGRFLLYYVPDPKTGTDLWVLPAATREPYLFLRTDANELWGQFSPDGRWVAYQSNETGRYEIYVRAFPARGGPIPVSTSGGVYPRWSRNGKEIYFIAPDAKLVAVPMSTSATMAEAGTPVTLFQTQRLGGGMNVIARGHQYDVTADGRFLINVDSGSSATPITLLLNWKP